MGLIVLVLACALVLGWLSGGRLAALADLPVRSWRLLLTALLVQVGAAVALLVGVPAAPVTVTAVVVSGLLAALFCVRNRAVNGVALLGLGLLSNGLVIGLNGAMPVSAHAAARAGVEWRTVLDDQRHEAAHEDTVLRPISDVIPVPLPWRPEVLSVGDLLVAAGVAQFVLTAMLRGGRTSAESTPSGGPRARRTSGARRTRTAPLWGGAASTGGTGGTGAVRNGQRVTRTQRRSRGADLPPKTAEWTHAPGAAASPPSRSGRRAARRAPKGPAAAADSPAPERRARSGSAPPAEPVRGGEKSSARRTRDDQGRKRGFTPPLGRVPQRRYGQRDDQSGDDSELVRVITPEQVTPPDADTDGNTDADTDEGPARPE